MSILSFSKPDERTRQLRYRAGMTAALIMMALSLVCSSYFLYLKTDSSTGDIIFLWSFIGLLYAAYIQHKARITGMVKEEINRNDQARKKTKSTIIFIQIPIFLIFIFSINYFFRRSSIKESLADGIISSTIMAIVLWWTRLRRTKKNKENNGII
jgi:ABC-type Mn2+/Zn2+ transport system permease subunit